MNYFQSAGDPNININENNKEEIINPTIVLPSVNNKSENIYSQYKKDPYSIDDNYGISYASNITIINQYIIDNIPKKSNLDLVLDSNSNTSSFIKNEPIFINNEPYNLVLQSLQSQIETIKNNENDKKKIDFLFNATRFKSDYIDMVHDFRICFDYIKDIFPEQEKETWIEIFNNVQQICTLNHNINVDKSHESQIEVFKNMVKELRSSNFNLILPDIPDFQVITESNKKSVEYIETFYRESGRGLDKFMLGKKDDDDDTDIKKNKKNKLSSNNSNSSNSDIKLPESIQSNAIGAIDGCPKGQCSPDIANQEILWEQNIAGFIDIIMKTNYNKQPLQTNIQINIENAGFSMVVNLQGELILNNILLFLPDEFSKAIRVGSLKNKITIQSIKYQDVTTKNNISLQKNIDDINNNGNDTEGNEKNKKIENFTNKKLKNLIYTSLISLKTICDKTVIQLIKDGSKGNENKSIDAICTIDSYVFAVPLLEYLTGNIEYCPTTLCSNKFGYTKFSYETNFIDNNELDGKFIMLYCLAQVFIINSNIDNKNDNKNRLQDFLKKNINSENLLKLDELKIIENYFDNVIANMYNNDSTKKNLINEYLNNIKTYLTENILFTNSIIIQSKSVINNSNWEHLWEFFEMKTIFNNQILWKNNINELSKKIKYIILKYFNNNSNKEVDFQKKLSSEVISIPYILPSLTETCILLEQQSNILQPISISEYFENLLYNDIYNFELNKLDENIKKEEPNFNKIIGKKNNNLSSDEQILLESIKKLNENTSNIRDTLVKNLFPKELHSYNDDEIKNIIIDYEKKITNKNEYNLSYDLIYNEKNLKKLPINEVKYYFGIINNITNYYGIENDIYVKLELNVSERSERSYITNFIMYFNNEVNDSVYPAYYERDKTVNNSSIYYLYIPYTAELLIVLSKKIINLNNTASFIRKKGYDKQKQNSYLDQIEDTLYHIMKDKYLLNLNVESKQSFKEFFNYFINVEREKYDTEGNKEKKFKEPINSVWNRLFSNQDYDNKGNNQIVAQSNLEDANVMDTNAMETAGEEVEASSPEKKRTKREEDQAIAYQKEEKPKINMNNVMDIVKNKTNKRGREQELEEENKINNTLQPIDISSPVKNKDEKSSIFGRVMKTFKRKRTTGGVRTYKNKK